jgi:hypothetical protein
VTDERDMLARTGDGLEDCAAANLRATIHQTNNFLGAVLVYAETALAKDDPAAMRRALELLVSRSRALDAFLREQRRVLGNVS